MALYGQEYLEEVRDISDYINNHFLNTVLDEKAQEFYNEIESFRESGEGRFEIAKKLIELTDEEFKDFDNLIKEHLIESYLEAVNYRSLLEYSGNPKKNAEFKETLQDLDRILVHFIKLIGLYEKVLDTCTKNFSSCKDVDSARKAFTDTQKEAKSIDKLAEESAKGAGFEKSPFNRFERQIRKFNNKYSTVGMEEKKKFDSKLGEYYNKVNDMIAPWAIDNEREKLDALNDAYVNFNEYMPELFDKAAGIAQYYYELMFDCYRTVTQGCIYLRRSLGIEKEHGIIYKMVQKIFKK